jgi:hypothetical protein
MNGDLSHVDESLQNEVPPSKKLELTLNPEDGSLQTVPLYQVVLAGMDAVYADLYNMAQGELDVYTTTTTNGSGNAAVAMNDVEDVEASSESHHAQQQQQPHSLPLVPAANLQHKKERMTNLSFAQRRHELSWRVSQGMKCIQQIAALTAASVSTDLGTIVDTSTRALQHTRTAWVQADEAQDAMYFFHAQLFPARTAPSDIYGACDVLLHGRWYDLPYDLLLNVDRYNNSVESGWSKKETDQRWQLTVRDKLIMGEVGWMRRQQLTQSSTFESPLWKVTLTGGIVKLTAGRPKYLSSMEGEKSGMTIQYPIEAMLTAFPSKLNMWTLMSVEVNVQAKTGEYNHQLDFSNRQRYDLHRIAMTAMRKEEMRHHQEQTGATLSATKPMDEIEENLTLENDLEEASSAPSRPLQALFNVTHMFLMAWQLELISAQAQALRRGVWATTTADGSPSSLLSVKPVRFFDNSDGQMSISFWKVDDSYGPPSMGDLNRNYRNTDNASSTASGSNTTLNRGDLSSVSDTSTSSQLTLSIRAESSLGIIVSLSGGIDIMRSTEKGGPIIQSTINALIEAATNPMALSASDALLAATQLCAEFKCQAVTQALQPNPTINNNGNCILPTWIQLHVQSGCIEVGTRINYHGVVRTSQSLLPSRKCIIFQMSCDARTGSFVVTFPRSMHLLRLLVCDDVHASAPVALRIASLPINRRRTAGSNSTGRVVREAFDSLVRSMNLLGQRVGVGGRWDDIDDRSYLLRQRAIQSACEDVKTALISCCGIAALFGVVPVALGGATGLDANPDM